MNTFDEARKYFEKFVQNHSREYFESMREYGSRSYGEFLNSSEIIQTSRDIAHNLREEFCDLEIGNHFVSPKHLIDTVKNLKNHLQSKDAVFKKTIDYYTKREGSLPLPVSGIDIMRQETIEACNHFLKLVDEEQQKDQEQEQKNAHSRDDKPLQVNINVNNQVQAQAAAQAQSQIQNNAEKNSDDYAIVARYMENIGFVQFWKLLGRVKLKTLVQIISSVIAFTGLVFSAGYEWRFVVNKGKESKTDSVQTVVPSIPRVSNLPSESEEKNNMLELDITSDEAVAVWGGEVMITMEFNSVYNNLIFTGIVGWTKDPESSQPYYSEKECSVKKGEKVVIKRKNGERWVINILRTGVSSVKIAMIPYILPQELKPVN